MAWKIALAHRVLAAPSLLDTYDIERIPVVAQMLATTTNLYEHAVAKSAKHAPKEATDGSGLLRWRNRALTLLEVNYRFSPLSFDIRGDEGRSKDDMLAHAYEGYGPDGGVRAGDRAPEAPGLVDTKGNGRQLSGHIEELGLHHHVVGSVGDVADKETCPHLDTILADSLTVTEQLREYEHLRYIPVVLSSVRVVAVPQSGC